MNDDPTPEVIADALKRAKQFVTDGVHVNEALAKATSTAQCQGYMGFVVFAKTRDAVRCVLPTKMSYDEFCATATLTDQLNALDSAYLVVKS